MGFIETLLLLSGLGGAMYFSVYYLIPAMQQMAYAPYYYLASQQQPQQQQQPAAAPTTPTTTPETTTPTETPETEEEETDTEDIEESVEDVLKDNGLVSEAPEEEPAKPKSTRTLTGEMSAADLATFKAKRAQEGAEAARKSAAIGGARPGPSLMGLYGSSETFRPRMRKQRYIYVDNEGNYWELL